MMVKAARDSFLGMYREQVPALHERLPDGSDVRVYSAPRDRAILLAFFGTAGKPRAHVSYRKIETAIEAARQLLASQVLHVERIATERQTRSAFRTTLEPGRVLKSTWGYDQTNVDYYQVVAVSDSRQSVTIRPIAVRSVEDGPWMTGHCWPLADQFTGPEMVKRVSPGERVKVRDWGAYASPWEPKADRWTAYA